MNKSTLYTLLCTTILAPAMIMAADQPAEPQTPGGKIAKLKQKERDLPTTPVIKQEIASKIDTSLFTPTSKARVEDMAVDIARMNRDQERNTIQASIEAQESERIKKQIVLEEREKAERERAAALEQASRRQSELVKGHTEKTDALQKVNDGLREELDATAQKRKELEEQRDELNRRLSSALEASEQADRKISSFTQEADKLKAEVALAEQKVASEKAQKDFVLTTSAQNLSALKGMLDRKLAECDRERDQKLKSQQEVARLKVQVEEKDKTIEELIGIKSPRTSQGAVASAVADLTPPVEQQVPAQEPHVAPAPQQPVPEVVAVQPAAVAPQNLGQPAAPVVNPGNVEVAKKVVQRKAKGEI